MPKTSLRISGQTSITELQYFLRDNKDAKLHGKRNKDGVTFTLYVSKGGSAASYAFSKLNKKDRRAGARQAILQVLENYKDPRNAEESAIFDGHFKEIDAGLGRSIGQSPSERVQQLEDLLCATLKHGIEGNKSKVQHAGRALLAQDIMSRLAPVDAPKNLQRKNIAPSSKQAVRDFEALGIHYTAYTDDEGRDKIKCHHFFEAMALNFQAATGDVSEFKTPQEKNFIEALTPVVNGLFIFPAGAKSSELKEFANATRNFIIDSGLQSACPFEANPGQEILALGATMLRKLPEIANTLFVKSLQSSAMPAHVATELNGQERDLKAILFGAELFTNEKFLQGVGGESKKKQIRDFGENLKNLFVQLMDPAGPYQILLGLGSLASESPAKFHETLCKYKQDLEDHGSNAGVRRLSSQIFIS